MARKLTDKAVENATAGASRREIPDALLPGLYLVVQPTGSKSWAVRFRFKGMPCKHTLGGSGLSLAAARAAAGTALRRVAEGEDPREIKRRERAADKLAFDAIAREFLDRHARKHTREASWRETARILGYKPEPGKTTGWVTTREGVAHEWRHKQIGDITRRDVLALLDGHIDRGAPIMANRVLAAVRKLFSWALSRDYVAASPCAGVSRPAAETSRDRVLSDDELRLVWLAAERIGRPFGPVVQMLILALQRRDEVGEIRPAEIDFDKGLWTIPGERVKNGQAHEVPLSEAALSILRSAPIIGRRRDGYIFTSDGEKPLGGYSKAKIRLDAAILAILKEQAEARGDDPRRVTPPERWTLHDLRRTGASGMARLGINLPVIEKLLNHTSGSFKGIVGVYQRHAYAAEKRSAIVTWANFITDLVSDAPRQNVVPLRAAQGAA